MASTVEIDTGIGETGVAAPRRTFRSLRTYTFLAAVIAGLLLGVGLRFVPATASATPDNAAQGAGATACAAK